jgi:hypothetical protein
VRHPILFGLLLTASIAGPARVSAQRVEVPSSGLPAGQDDKTTKVFDAQHLKDLPYNGNLPEPAFPSSQRVQRTFTVAMIYDYAYSAYTPAVDLPIISPLQAKRDTPESAAIAFFSAQRNGDFKAFLECWTEPDRKLILDNLKSINIEPAALVAKWKAAYGGKKVQLVDRIETTGYVILDLRVPGPRVLEMPVTMKLVKSEWMATNELGYTANPITSLLKPGLAGIIDRVQPVPVEALNGAAHSMQLEAQKQFLAAHTRQNEIDEAGK